MYLQADGLLVLVPPAKVIAPNIVFAGRARQSVSCFACLHMAIKSIYSVLDVYLRARSTSSHPLPSAKGMSRRLLPVEHNLYSLYISRPLLPAEHNLYNLYISRPLLPAQHNLYNQNGLQAKSGFEICFDNGSQHLRLMGQKHVSIRPTL